MENGMTNATGVVIDPSSPSMSNERPIKSLSPVLELPTMEVKTDEHQLHNMDDSLISTVQSSNVSTPRSDSPVCETSVSVHGISEHPVSVHRRCVSDCMTSDINPSLNSETQSLTPPFSSAPSNPSNSPGSKLHHAVSLEPSSLLSAVYISNSVSPSASQRYLVPNSSFSSLSSLVSISTDLSIGEVDGSSVRSFETDAATYGFTRSSASLEHGTSEDSGVVAVGEDGKHGRKYSSLTGFFNSALYKFSGTPLKKINGVTRSSTAPSSTTALILNDRPEGVPAKDPKESKRHAAEYLKLVERIKRGETELKKKAEDEEIRRFQRELRIRGNLDVWRSDIIPNWQPRMLRVDRQRRNLLWEGVPGPLREKAWPFMVGNELGITRETFDQCLRKLRAVRPEVPVEKGSRNSKACAFCSATCASGGSGAQSLHLICSDIVRTFPKLSFFQVDGPQHRDMVEVLGAYAYAYRPEVGYCQGMSFLAAVLLLNLPSPYEAFVCLANLLNRPVLHSLYCGDLGEKFNAYRAVFDHYLMRVLPELHLHFEKIGLDSRIYLLSWLLTIFSSTLPLDCSFRVWDLYLVDGDYFLFRAALGLLRCLQSFLLKQCYDLAAEFLTKMIPDDTITPSKLFPSIRSIAVDSHEFHSLLEEAQRDETES